MYRRYSSLGNSVKKCGQAKKENNTTNDCIFFLLRDFKITAGNKYNVAGSTRFQIQYGHLNQVLRPHLIGYVVMILGHPKKKAKMTA